MKKFLFAGLCFCQLLITGISVSKEHGNIDLSVPENYGSIKEQFTPRNGLPSVIFVQDIHTSASAQKHLADIILYLYKKHGISIIGIEGAAGNIDTSELSIFPDKTVKKYVAEYFYKKGRIDGAEYLSIVENTGQGNDIFKLFGIEDTDLYKQNLNAYTCSLPYRDILTGFADSLCESTNSIKPHVYSKSLMKLDKTIRSFHSNNQDFISYCKNIVEFANRHDIKYEDLSNLIKLLETTNLEKNIDFNRADSERSYAVLDLSSQIPEGESSALLRKELLFKSQQIPVKQYLTYLDDLFIQYDYDISSYINLKNFIRYADLYSNINKTTLLKETINLEKDIYAKLITTAQQQTLYDISKYASLVSKFANLQMSRRYFDQYKHLAEKINLPLIEKFIKDKNNRYGLKHSLNIDITTVELVLKNFEDFYRTAQMRERDMVTNLLKLLKNSTGKPVILVAGGYHCRGITETLRAKNVSYVVITPSTAKDNFSIPYLTLLNNFKTPLEELIAANTSTLKLASWLAVNPLTQENLRPILLTKMKTLFTATKLHLLYKKALSEQPDLKGDIAFRENIQDNLKNAINDVILMAGYDNILRIDSVEISNSGLSAQITFLQKNQPVNTIAVVFTETPDVSSRLNDETRDNLLELVNLSTGLNEEFLDYAGYFSLRVKSTSTKILILKNLSTTDRADLALLTRDVNLAVHDNSIRSEHILDNINNLIQDGMVDTEKDGDRTLYFIRKNDSRQDILDILSRNNYSSTLETGTIVIKTDNLPDDFRDKYPNLCSKIFLITADATIGFVPLFETISQILNQESDLVENPNSMSIPSSQIGVDCIKNQGNGLFSLHIKKVSSYENNADWLSDDTPVSAQSLSLRNIVKIKDYTRHSLEETELDLFTLAQLGHEPSMENLLKKYHPLVKKLASKTFYSFRHSVFAQQGLDLQDFITAGQVGLAEAIKTFDPSKGFTFMTYAWRVISNSVTKEMNTNATVKVHTRKNIATVLYGISVFREKYGGNPSPQELAKFLNNGFTVELIKKALEVYKSNPTSLNTPLSNDKDASTLEDFVEDKNPDTYSDKTAIKNNTTEKLNIALTFLTDMERDILEYHIMEETGVLDDLAEKYNLSKERIRQIEAEALRKMKPILEFLMSSKSDVIEKISKQLQYFIGQLSPQEREIIMLSVSDSMPNKTIAEILNFDSRPKLAQYRINIVHKLRKQMLVRFQHDKHILKTLLDKKIKFEMFIRLAKKREYNMIDILTDFAKEQLDSSISVKDLRDILENYEDFLTPYEQELILLRYHYKLESKEVGEITSRSISMTTYKYILIQRKLQSVISLNAAIDPKTTLLFKKFLLDGINDISLEMRNHFLDMFYDNLPLEELEEKYGVTKKTIHRRKKTVITELFIRLHKKNEQLGLDQIPLKDFQYLSRHLTEEFFEPFLMGLIYNIKRDEFSKIDKIEPKYQVNLLLSFLTPKEKDIINQNITPLKNLTTSSAIDELDETDTYKPDDSKTEEDHLKELEKEYGLDKDQIGRFQENIIEKLKPIASFVSNVNRSDLAVFKKLLNDKLKNLPLQEQEILILTYVQAKSDTDIVAGLNFDSETSLYKKRKKIIRKLKNQLFRSMVKESYIKDFLSAEETDFEMVLNAFLEFHQEDMTDILAFFAVKKLQTTIPYDKLLGYFKDYENFVTPYEQELITLFNNRHLTATQVGKITNQHMNGVSQNYALVQKKIRTVLSFRDKLSQNNVDIFTKPLLNSINKIELLKRNIFLDIFYNGLSSNKTAEKHGKHRAWVYQVKTETLAILRQALWKEYETAKKSLNPEDSKIIEEQLQEDNFEPFLQGLIYNIKSDQFSKEEYGPKNISEILMKLTKEKINPKIQQSDLSTLIEDATFFVQPFFITQLNYDIFVRRYIDGINQTQIAREFNLSVHKVRNIIRYRTEALKDFLGIYETLTPKEIEDVRLLIADSIMEIEFRRKQTLVYFAYDGLNYVEIEKVRGSETTDRSAQIKFQRIFSDLQKRVLSKVTSDKIKTIFEGNVIHLKYFIRGMNRSIPRKHFNIPELILTEETEDQEPIETAIPDSYKYKPKYDKLFLENLLSRLDNFNDQTDIEENLSTALDTLTEKQIFFLDLSLKNELTQKNVHKKYDIRLSRAEQQLKVAITQLKGFINFYNIFSKQDLSFLRNTLTDIITELPIPYKFSLILRYYDNLTLKQMTEASGLKTESNHNLVRAIHTLEKQFLEKLGSNNLKDSFVGQRENLRYLICSLKTEIPREKFGVQAIEKDKLSQPDSAEDLYKSMDTDERISVYVSLLQAINELSIDERITIIAYFYDRLKKPEIQYLFKLDTGNKNFERTLRRIQSNFADKLTTPRLKNFFADDIKNVTYFLNKMSNEIPRSLFDIPIHYSEQTSSETTSDDKNKDTASKEETPSAWTNYTQKNVNRLYYNLADDWENNVDEFKKYLLQAYNHPEIPLPDPIVLANIRYFSEIYRLNGKTDSMKETLDYFVEETNIMTLNFREKATLFNVLIKSRLLNLDISKKDQIVLDFDTLGFHLNTPSNNVKVRKLLIEHIKMLQQVYDKKGRRFNITVVSKKLTTRQMETLLSPHLFGSLWQNNILWGNDKLQSFGELSDQETYIKLMFSTLRANNLNPVNLKVFSDNPNFVEGALSIGAVCANRHGSVFDAFKTFANIHPDKSANLATLKTHTNILDLAKNNLQGYFALSGHEFCIPVSEESKQSIRNKKLIDQSM